ncbi:MAG: DUF5131 family protein [Candidatus Nitrospinota bacterium M3_3B_026]
MVSKARLERGRYWDRVWPLVSGCARVSVGCDGCGALCKKSAVSIRPGSLDAPLKNEQPKTWIIRNDLFHPAVPDGFIIRAFGIIGACPHHLFIVITKRPDRMARLLLSVAPLSNVFIGISAESQQAADMRIPYLRRLSECWSTLASLDPLLDQIDLANYLDALDWVIIGAGSAGRCEMDWIWSLARQCDAVDIPVFVRRASLKGRLVKTPFILGRRRLETPG